MSLFHAAMVCAVLLEKRGKVEIGIFNYCILNWLNLKRHVLEYFESGTVVGRSCFDIVLIVAAVFCEEAA